MPKLVDLRLTVSADERAPVLEIAKMAAAILRLAGQREIASAKGDGSELPLGKLGSVFFETSDVKIGAPRGRASGGSDAA